MIGRWRLVDAVAVAAGALLSLKVLGLASGTRASDAVRPSDKAGVAVQQNQAFAEALARARTNYRPPEVLTTNAVTKPDETGDQAKQGADEKPGAAPPPPRRRPRPLPSPAFCRRPRPKGRSWNGSASAARNGRRRAGTSICASGCWRMRSASSKPASTT